MTIPTLTDRVDEAEVDALFADSAGPWLRLYVAARLAEQADAPPLEVVLEEMWVGVLACGVLVHAGDRQSFQNRLYGLVDAVLPHLGRPALRRAGDDPELRERGRRFVRLIASAWHGGFDQALASLLALAPREREAVLLRDHHALSMHEIGLRLGLGREEARAFVDASRAKARAPRGP